MFRVREYKLERIGYCMSDIFTILYSLFLLGIYVAYYILSSSAWARIAKFEQIRWSGVAWIPFIGSNFIISRLVKWRYWWAYPSLFSIVFIMMFNRHFVFLRASVIILSFVFVIQITQLFNHWGIRTNLVIVLMINGLIELYLLTVSNHSLGYRITLNVVMMLNLWFAIFLKQLAKSRTQQEERSEFKRSA